METALVKEFKREIVKYSAAFILTALLTLLGFYFNTKSILAAHEMQIDSLKVQVDRKADQGTVEKRLDRIENKLDKIYELQINK